VASSSRLDHSPLERYGPLEQLLTEAQVPTQELTAQSSNLRNSRPNH